MVEWETVAVNTILSLTVAFLVGLYIRYKIKPKHEEVFEHNRNEEFRRIFDTINLFDIHFEFFLNDLEREMGEINVDRETLTIKPQFKETADGGRIVTFSREETEIWTTYEQLKPLLKSNYDHMKNFNELFQKDYLRLLNHIENSFLKNVWDYFFKSYYYAEWAQKDYLMNNLMVERMKAAQKIINFLENDNTIDITEPNIKKFITRWKGEFEKSNSLL